VREICAEAISAKMTVDTNPLLAAYMFGITALVFLNAWPALTKRPPLHHLGKADRWRHWQFFHLPSMRAVESLQWFANAFLAVSSVYYLYVTRDPVGTHDSNYYFTLEILFFVLCFTKCFWQHFLFAHYRHNIGLGLGIISSIANTALSVTLIIILGIRAADADESWVPFAFMFPVALYYFLTVCWSCHIAKHHGSWEW